MKKCISFILAFVFVIGLCSTTPITFTANAASVGDLTFELTEDGNSYMVKECAKSATGIIEVPATYDSKPVTAIAMYSFEECENITEIKLTDTITKIGVGAFQNCKNLKAINYPSSLVEIGAEAFAKCESLTSITIPNGVKMIPNDAFDGARYLTEITIPSTVEEIGTYAFYGCEGLSEIKLPDGLKKLGYATFYGCKNLKAINYPSSLIEVGAEVFAGCESLTSITIPDGVKIIPNNAFDSARYLTEITIPVSVEKIGTYAFYSCEGLTEIKLPLALKEIHFGAFENCDNLKTVTYQGFAEQWADIDIADLNEVLTSATIVCLDHTHSYKETVLKQPTCTEKGEKAYVCECGYTYTGDIKALGHNYSKDFTIDKQPTYEKTGSKSRHCTRCDAKTDVTVIPKLVLGVPAVTQKNTAKGITLSWSAIKDAESYIVYRRTYNESTKKYSGWTVLKKGYTETSYTDTTVKLGTTYSYAVKAANKDATSSYTPTKVLTYNVIPTVKVANASNGIKVSWSTAANATGYTVYSSTYNTKTKKWSGWTNRGTTKANATSWVDKKAKSGTKYRYTIKAMNDKVGSTYNKDGAATLYLAQPTVKIANASTGVKVSWSKVTGATGYTVYRSEYKNGAWTKWASRGTAKANKTSWTDTKVASGVQYKYTVRAINGKVASTYVSSNTVLYLAQPKTTVKAVSNGINVAWTQSTGATGYTVYRMEYNTKTKKWSGWKKMGTAKSSKTNWTDKSAKKGVQYKYTVKAVNGKAASTYKASGSVKR